MPRPGFTLCACPDSQLIKDHIDAQLDAYDSGQGAWQRHVFWGEEGLPPTFWEALTLQGLFATPKALVVRNAQNLSTDDWKTLSQALGSVNPLAWPFLCLEVPFEKGAPKLPKATTSLRCWAFAEKNGWLWKSEGLSPRDMRDFVSRWGTRHGAVIPPPALDALARNLPSDAMAATRELEKLSLAAEDGKTISPELAATIVRETELDIFAFISALQRGNAPDKVWNKVVRGHESDDGIFRFLAMLLREARILWQLLAGESVYLPGQVRQSKEQLARSMGRARVARLWDLALEAEKGIKTGERIPEQAMEMLVAGLMSLFGGASAAKSGGARPGSSRFTR